MHYLRLALKLVCYLALAFVGAGIAAMVFVDRMGGCPCLDEGSVQCISPFYYSVGGYGLGVVMVSVFTGLPAFLALAGLVLLIRDLWRSRKRVPST